MIMQRILVSWMLIQMLNAGVQAQKSLFYEMPDQDLQIGSELFEKQKYVAAQHYFDRFREKNSSVNTESKSDADYYASLCAMELFNPDAENRLINFMNANQGYCKINEAYFNMGHYLYTTKKYTKAVDWFEKV